MVPNRWKERCIGNHGLVHDQFSLVTVEEAAGSDLEGPPWGHLKHSPDPQPHASSSFPPDRVETFVARNESEWVDQYFLSL